MDDNEAFAALMNFLESSGEVVDDRAGGIVTVHRYDGVRRHPPLHLHLTPASLGERLRRSERDASSAFPDVEPDRAAWQLFTVHVEEAIHTAVDGRTELVLDRYGVRPVSPEELADAPTEDEQRAFDELVDHLTERGDVVADRWRGPITILEHGEVPIPPVRFEVTPRSLGEHLRATGTEWSSFLTAVDEAIGAAGSDGSGLALTESGIALVGGPR
ncbi:MAG: hypothetical protein M3235_21825 [Actinomycetota bacterium]|nr:hypothetical protein [Actinomycetota bacterium]